MDEKNKRSSSASDDDAETKKHEKSDVETDHVSSSKSLKSGNRVLEPCSGSKVELKEQEKHKEIKSEETKEMTKFMKALLDLQGTLTKPDILEMVSLKENSKDTQEKENKKKGTCCFDCKEAEGNNQDTIFVKGFQKLRPRKEIKKMLSGLFVQCGKIRRVFVPMECETRVPLGYAFINFKSPQDKAKALEFNGRSLEGKKLKVTLASKRGEFYAFTNFGGCDRCIARLRRPKDPRPLPRMK